MNQPLTIGWKEYVEFPEWGLSRVKVKIDTGARTSALGVVEYRFLPADPEPRVELTLDLYRRHPERRIVILAPVLRQVRVRNSGGVTQVRPVVGTDIRLGPITKRVEFTVTRRPRMLTPILLGRFALDGDFLVDVGRKFLLPNCPSI